MAKPVLNMYVLHSPALVAVREAMCKALEERLGSLYTVRSTYITQKEAEDLRQSFDLTAPSDAPDPVFSSLVSSLHIRQASNALKHLEALRAVAAGSSSELHMVIEDDVLFNNDVAEQLKRVATLAAVDGAGLVMLGMPMVGETASAADPANPRLVAVADTFRVMPCCDSYLVTPTAARKVADAYLPCRFAANIQLSYVCARAGVAPKSVIPNLFADGSKVGVYISSLSHNNRLFLNEDYNKLIGILRRDEQGRALTEGDRQEASAIFEACRFKGHPDMGYAMSVIEAKTGHAEKALEMMGQAFEVYRQNGALLGNESDFLRNYIALHRVVADKEDAAEPAPAPPPTPAPTPAGSVEGRRLPPVIEEVEDITPVPNTCQQQ